MTLVSFSVAQAQDAAYTPIYDCSTAYQVPEQKVTGANYNDVDDDFTSTRGKTIKASELRTPEDVRAFVRCARDFIKSKLEENPSYSLQQLQQDFQHPQWKNDTHYIWVDQNAKENVQSQIFPPDTSKQGKEWPDEEDPRLLGFDFKYAFHIVSRWIFEPAEGYIYYTFNNPDSNTRELKISYILKLDSKGFPEEYTGTGYGKNEDDGLDPDGDGFVIGAGVYPAEIQAPTWQNSGCKARDLEAAPTPDKLQAFVRCAARKYAALSVGQTGVGQIKGTSFFSTSIHNRDQLKHGSIYTFMIDASADNPEDLKNARLKWSAQKTDDEQNGRSPEWMRSSSISTRNSVAVARDMGESFLYYGHTHPVTEQFLRKVVFLKLLPTSEGEVLLGAGYYLPDGARLEPEYDCNAAHVRNITAGSVETRDDLKAFVMKAKCHIEDVGIAQAQQDFRDPRVYWRPDNKIDTQWFSYANNMYLFVDDHKQRGSQSTLYIYPPNPHGRGETDHRRYDVDNDDNPRKGKPSHPGGTAWVQWDNNGGHFRGEGTPYGDYDDAHGNSYYEGLYYIQQQMREGWMYYNFTDHEASAQPWKASYIARFDGRNDPPGSGKYRIGAGLYERGAPGSCKALSANTGGRDADESEQSWPTRLQTLQNDMDAQVSLIQARPEEAKESIVGNIADKLRPLLGLPNVSKVYLGQHDLDAEIRRLRYERATDKAARELQDFVRCAAHELSQHTDVEAAKKTFVTGENVLAEYDAKLDNDRLASRWRSTWRLKRGSATCNNPDRKLEPAIPAAPAYEENTHDSRLIRIGATMYWDSNRNGRVELSDGDLDRNDNIDTFGWAGDHLRLICGGNPNCGPPKVDGTGSDVIITQAQAGGANNWQSREARARVAAKITKTGNCTGSNKAQGVHKDEPRLLSIRDTLFWRTDASDDDDNSKQEVHWTGASGNELKYVNPAHGTSVLLTRNLSDSDSTNDYAASGFDFTSSSTNNTDIDMLLDGQYANTPIYTFLYDEGGKLLWGRDASQHQWKVAFDIERRRREDNVNQATQKYNACKVNNPRRHATLCHRFKKDKDAAEKKLQSHKDAEASRLAEFEGSDPRNSARQGHKLLSKFANLGEAFVYYPIKDYKVVWVDTERRAPDDELTNTNRRTGSWMVSGRVNTNRHKRSFMKKVRTRDGQVYYIGAGLYE